MGSRFEKPSTIVQFPGIPVAGIHESLIAFFVAIEEDIGCRFSKIVTHTVLYFSIFQEMYTCVRTSQVNHPTQRRIEC